MTPKKMGTVQLAPTYLTYGHFILGTANLDHIIVGLLICCGWKKHDNRDNRYSLVSPSLEQVMAS